jgi:sodium/potassium/calcium exchanger 6
MAFSLPHSLKTIALFLSLLSSLLFFLLKSPANPFPFRHIPSRSLLTQTPSPCSNSTSNALLNYSCLFSQNPFLSILSLSLLILLFFYILIKTAQDHFSVVTTKLANQLNLSPSIGAVTLLALGNGAPDVFASVAALRGGQFRTGFGAILSAGTFVSALVVGFVAIYAAPFSVDPVPFVRDVLFYLIAALFLFYVYLSAEIFLWQAVGFVVFYVFFVGIVFWMDLGLIEGRGRGKGGVEVGLVGEGEVERGFVAVDCEIGEVSGNPGEVKPGFGFCRALGMVCMRLESFFFFFEKNVRKLFDVIWCSILLCVY